ncbi:MAG: MarC family protein, partial [Deltaproteobacteria bacterium]|nr:MarC family protein [Deltaproteobacteria bacterium]
MENLAGGAFVEYLRFFAVAFIPLLVAMEPIGVIPVYMSVTGVMGESERRRVLSYSIATAAIITLVFLVVGKAVFTVLGITTADFQIAGGLVLLSIAVSDIVQTARGIVPAKPAAAGIGIVPLGTPLIAGP